MKRSSLFVSLLAALLLSTSCSPRISGEGTSLPPVIELAEGSESQKYNIQLDFMKHHFSGMLIVRRMSGNEIRILAATHFGLSLFDFSLRGETFSVNSCIEPMKKEKILKLLEMDFKHLFLNGKNLRIRTTKDRSIEKRTSGKGFGKSVIHLSGAIKGKPAQVRMKHPWIRLTIRLNPLKDN